MQSAGAPGAAGHAFPQRPQLCASLQVKVSQPLEATPSQSVHPGSQVNPQTPRAQLSARMFGTVGHSSLAVPSPSAWHTER